MATKQKLTIVQGNTFEQIVRWETSLLTTKAITGIARATPVVITSVAHGVPEGWRVAVISAGGMSQINARTYPPRGSEFETATVLSADTIALPAVSSAGYDAYTSGGSLVYYTPQTLSGYTARMTIRDFVGGTELASLTTENSGILLDNANKAITVTISATDTAAYTWRSGVYDLELVSSSGVVTTLMRGSVAVTQEVTT
jgi:hypothetical protein